MIVTNLCLILCDPMNCSPPGSSAHEILYARILEWVAIPFFRRSSQLRDRNPHFLCLLHWQAGSLPLAHLRSPFVNYFILQQFHCLVYIEKKWNLYIKHLSSLPCSLCIIHNSENMEIKCPLTDECIKKMWHSINIYMYIYIYIFLDI